MLDLVREVAVRSAALAAISPTWLLAALNTLLMVLVGLWLKRLLGRFDRLEAAVQHQTTEMAVVKTKMDLLAQGRLPT